MEPLTPGWYPDSDREGKLRYFNGAAWTDLLPGSHPPPSVPPPPQKKQARRKSVKPATAFLLVVVIALAVAATGMYVNAVYHHRSVDSLLSGVEASESAMSDWVEDLAEFFTPCTQTEDADSCRAWWQDPSTKTDLIDLAAQTSRRIAYATAALGETEYGAVAPWHIDVLDARSAYLEHAEAWEEFLAVVVKAPETVLIDTPADDYIKPTFESACAALVDLQTPSLVGVDGTRHRNRIDSICSSSPITPLEGLA